jgi:tetratricopeptide (TPR) repeat protein
MFRFVRATVVSSLLLSAGLVFAHGSEEKDEPRPSKEIQVYNKGVKAMKKGDFQKAQKLFEEALGVKEDFAEAHNNLAFCLRKQGKQNFEESLKHYNRALELKPDLAQAYMYRGALYVLNGDVDKAKADLATLQKLDPKMAAELQRVIDTGKEKDGTDLYGATEKLDG